MGAFFSTVATDGLVLKHQAISIRSADQIPITWDQSTGCILLFNQQQSTHKQIKTNQCMLITVVIDALVLQHQAIG